MAFFPQQCTITIILQESQLSALSTGKYNEFLNKESRITYGSCCNEYLWKSWMMRDLNLHLQNKKCTKQE